MTTISPVMRLLNHSFKHVIRISELYKIDESHALKHSMEVYAFAKKYLKKNSLKILI